MTDIIFIGNCADAALFRAAGIRSYTPARDGLIERVLAERRRCQVLAMTAATFDALPADLARDLRQGPWPQLEIVPEVAQRRHGFGDLLHSLRRTARQPDVLMA